MASILPTFPTGSFPWLVENFGFDIVLGVGAYLILILGVPWLQYRARLFSYPSSKDGLMHERPLHPHWFVRYQMLRILALVPVLWGIFSFLSLSTGWKDPFALVNWHGITAQGWLFDLIYGRANDQPDGAHLLSWWGVALFGLVVCYKAAPKPLTKSFANFLADPFQGIAALVFIGGVHELLWVPFYYAAYAQYLNWTLWPEVLRDVSFVVMMALFIAVFWKYPKRVVPLKIFFWPVMAYVAYLLAWFWLPAFLGGPFLPITTLNNPAFGAGPYQETPYFAWGWVNAIEVGSWVLLWASFVIQVVRYHGPPETHQ